MQPAPARDRSEEADGATGIGEAGERAAPRRPTGRPRRGQRRTIDLGPRGPPARRGRLLLRTVRKRTETYARKCLDG